MQRLGFIHDMLDVKVLILLVASHSAYPMTMQEIYELCFQDECLSYFDVCTAIPEMVTSGHLREVGKDKYAITEKGRVQGEVTEDSVAYPVKIKALAAVEEFNHRDRRTTRASTRILTAEDGSISVELKLAGQKGTLMHLQLAAPAPEQAQLMSQLLEEKGDLLYHLLMDELNAQEMRNN